jgi:hypothetical protein
MRREQDGNRCSLSLVSTHFTAQARQNRMTEHDLQLGVNNKSHLGSAAYFRWHEVAAQLPIDEGNSTKHISIARQDWGLHLRWGDRIVCEMGFCPMQIGSKIYPCKKKCNLLAAAVASTPMSEPMSMPIPEVRIHTDTHVLHIYTRTYILQTHLMPDQHHVT